MWEAIASLAWTFLAAFVLYKLWPSLTDILRRDGTIIRVGNLELTVAQAAKNLGKDVVDVQDRLAKLEAAFKLSAPDSVPQTKIERQIGKRLLWVDDFPSNNAFLVERLRENGVDVELSLSTADALKRLEHSTFPAIITDLGRMEGNVDNPYAGLELIQEIRQKGNNVPILVFAGRRGLEHRDSLIAAGAEDVTASGVDVNSFVEKYLLG